jgi:hypothetical protein
MSTFKEFQAMVMEEAKSSSGEQIYVDADGRPVNFKIKMSAKGTDYIKLFITDAKIVDSPNSGKGAFNHREEGIIVHVQDLPSEFLEKHGIGIIKGSIASI